MVTVHLPSSWPHSIDEPLATHEFRQLRAVITPNIGLGSHHAKVGGHSLGLDCS